MTCIRLPSVDWNRHPDGAFGWLMVVAVFYFYFVTMAMEEGFAIIYIDIAQTFGTSMGVTGWIVSIMAFAYCTMGVVAAPLVDRFGCRFVAMTGTLLSFIGVLASAFATSVFMMYFTALLSGGACGMLLLLGQVLMNTHFRKYQGRATALAHLGFATSGLYGGFHRHLADIYGWRGAVLILSAVMLQGLPFAMLCRIPSQKTPPTFTDVPDKEIAEKSTKSMDKDFMDDVRITPVTYAETNLCKTPRYWLYVAGRALLVSMVISHRHHFLNRCRFIGIGVHQLSLLVVYGVASALVVELVLCLIVDKACINRFWMLSVACMSCVLFLVLVPLTTNFTLLTIFFLAFRGITLGIGVPTTYSILVIVTGLDKLPLAEGVANFATGVVVLIAIPLLGWMADLLGGFDEVFFTMAAILTVVTIAFIVLTVLQGRVKERRTTIVIDLDASAKAREALMPTLS